MSFRELPSSNATSLHGRQNIMVCHDGTTLVIQWEILPSPSRKFERRLSASVLVDGEEDNVSNEANEAFGALVESGQCVTDPINSIARKVFDVSWMIDLSTMAGCVSFLFILDTWSSYRGARLEGR